jgi:hypothetical protein
MPGHRFHARRAAALRLSILAVAVAGAAVTTRDGAVVAATTGDHLSHDTSEPGVYRVEARVDAHGGARTWLVSNPIYLRR